MNTGQNNMKLRKILGILLALVGIGAIAMFFLHPTGGTKTPAAGTSKTPSGVPVIVTKEKILAGSELTANNLTIAYMSEAPTGSSGTLQTFVSTTTPLYAKVTLSQGEPLTLNLTVSNQSQAQVGNANIAPLPVPNSDVVMSIPYAEATDGGGFIVPGDHIDVLINDNGTVLPAIQDIEVYNVGFKGGSGVPSVLVVFATRTQASELTYLTSNLPGSPTIAAYVIRPTSENGTGTLSTPSINAQYWKNILG